MTLQPALRTRLSAAFAAVVAVWLGSAVAQGEFALPFVVAGLILAVIVRWIQPLPLTAILLGGVLAGYVVGNRGFAQLSLTASLPLLPAEVVLAAGGTIVLLHFAWRRQIPWRSDALNYALLVWLAFGIGRIAIDAGVHGFVAVRDFALVYYALFFFLAQHVASDRRCTRFLHACFASSCAVLLVTQTLFDRFPELFLGTLTVRGIPVIFYKGDLSATFMAAGSVVYFLAFERTGRWRHLFASLLLTGGCLATNNRSSMFALALVTVLLLLARRWRLAAFQAGAGALGAALILLVAHVENRPWEQTPLYGVYERVSSLTDPFGERSYSGEDTFYKGDNNRFRSVWWRTIWDETLETNPWFGVGFGHDLAARFVRQYYPEAMDEFTARSPHNVILTVFARMGVLGLIPFLVATVALCRRAFLAAQRAASYETALWGAALVVFLSACFGVVLEGPMGAVVFWTLLGTANGAHLAASDTLSSTDDPAITTEEAAPPAAPLPTESPRV